MSSPTVSHVSDMQTQPSSLRSPLMTASPPLQLGASGCTSASRSSSQCLGSGPWPNYEFPSKWEVDDDFMCVHFIPRTSDQHTWRSQSSFWGEAIALYARQLLWQCPHAWNRLTFTPKDIVFAYTRKNRLQPMCIVDILRVMKHREHSILFADFIHDHYAGESNTLAQHISRQQQQHQTSTCTTAPTSTSFLSSSISGVSSMVTSVFGYLLPSTAEDSNDDSDAEADDADAAEEMKITLAEHQKCVYVPIMEQLCDTLSRLSFYRQSFDAQLSQLLEIALIVSDENTNEFIIAGLAFERVCRDVLRLTASDVCVLKQWLIGTRRASLFYMNSESDAAYVDGNTPLQLTATLASATAATDEDRAFLLKNEMIFFHAKHRQQQQQQQRRRHVSHDEWSKIQLLSIQLTMKHLRLQKDENVHVLDTLKWQLCRKLKNTPNEKRARTAFLKANRTLLERKKLLTNRISKLDGSLYNLESTLHSMEDVTLNKMVLLEMKNADEMLKQVLQNGPSVDEVERIHSGLQHSMVMNRELGDALGRPMDTDEIDEEELMREYDDLVMAEVQLPEAPSHDVVVKDQETADKLPEQATTESAEKVLLQQ